MCSLNGYNNLEMLFQGKMAPLTLMLFPVIHSSDFIPQLKEEGACTGAGTPPALQLLKVLLVANSAGTSSKWLINPSAASVIALQVGHDHPHGRTNPTFETTIWGKFRS